MATDVMTQQPLRNGINSMPHLQTNVNNNTWHSAAPVAGPTASDEHGRRIPSADNERLLYWGAPRFHVPNIAGDEQDDENRVLPWYYEGRNPHLERVMFAAMTEAEQVFTREIAPIVPLVNGGNLVTMSQYIFNNHLLDRVPEQGVIRLVTSFTRRWTAALNRYGLGLQMEEGFAMTPMGKMHYHQHLLQIRDALLACFRLQAIDHILGCPRQPANFYEANNMPNPNATMLDLLEAEANQWACLQKWDNAFLKLKEHAKRQMALNRLAAEPDTLILPNGLIDQYKYLHKEETEFSIAGPRGPALLHAPGGPIMAQATEFKVLEFPKCFVGENEPLVDLSSRVRSIGEFFQMSSSFHENVAPALYRSALRNIIVHDNARDQMVELRFLDALRASGLWNTAPSTTGRDGRPSRADMGLSPLGRQFFAGANTFGDWIQMHDMQDTCAQFWAAKADALDRLRLMVQGHGTEHSPRPPPPETAIRPPQPARTESATPAGSATSVDATGDTVAATGTRTGNVASYLRNQGMAANVSDIQESTAQLHKRFSKVAGLCNQISIPFDDLMVAVLATPATPDGPSTRSANQRLSQGSKAMARLNTHFGDRELSPATRETIRAGITSMMRADRPLQAFDTWLQGILAAPDTAEDVLRAAQVFPPVPAAEGRAARVADAVRTASAAAAASGPGWLPNTAADAVQALMDLPIERITFELIQTMFACDLYLPFNCLLFRPHMTYQMGSGVTMKRGVQTMQTMIGNANFMLGRDASRKILLGNYTVYGGVVITAPENIYIMDNILCQGYLGGGGVSFYHWSPDMRRKYLNSNQCLPADIFVVVIPGSERITSNILDLTGHFPADSMQPTTSAQLNPQYSTAGMFTAAWGWRTSGRYFDNFEDFLAEPGYNTKMWQATQYMPSTDVHGNITQKAYRLTGHGHWGPNVYSGVRRDRCGSALTPIRNVVSTENVVEIGL